MANTDSDKVSTFIQTILLEVAIDARVPTGIFDAGDNLHLEILAEKLVDHDVPREIVVEMVNKLALMDGKYPDRQAYNKNGWLVTFPTPEHKAEAIKRKTHYASDPTHGRGGMNLYYKRKGKQARQSSPAPSSTVSGDTKTKQSTQPIKSVPTPIPVQGTPDSSSEVGDSQQNTPDQSTPKIQTAASTDLSQTNSGSKPEPKIKPVSTSSKVDGDAKTTNTTSHVNSVPASKPIAPVQSELPSSIVRLSVEFAKSKNWQDAPYGDWTDERGEQCAVTGMDGQIVPIKYVDRQELKSFAEKRMMEGIVLREAFQRLRFY